MPSALARCLLLCSITAAIGHQDCGQCGYSCQDYSDAVFARKEQRLFRCVPGGKHSARLLGALHQELSSPAPPSATMRAATATPADATAAAVAAPACWRERPAETRFPSRTHLNKPGMARDVGGAPIALVAELNKRGRYRQDVH